MRPILILNGRPYVHCTLKLFDVFEGGRVYNNDETHVGDLKTWQLCKRDSGRDVISIEVEWVKWPLMNMVRDRYYAPPIEQYLAQELGIKQHDQIPHLTR